MREILFRGKHKDAGWVYGYLNQHRGDSRIDVCSQTICSGDFFILDFVEKIDIGLYGCEYKIDPETAGQYIELTDKNGVKIFEGDIIVDSYNDKYVVKFSVERFGFFPFACGDGCGCCERDTIYPKSDPVEVIGNIYDNPELIEGAIQ